MGNGSAQAPQSSASASPEQLPRDPETEHDGEFEIGSIGVQTFTSSDPAWTWGIDTVLPPRDHQTAGRGADRHDCMVKFRKAWEGHCKQSGWLDEFLAMKHRLSRPLVDSAAPLRG